MATLTKEQIQVKIDTLNTSITTLLADNKNRGISAQDLRDVSNSMSTISEDLKDSATFNISPASSVTFDDSELLSGATDVQSAINATTETFVKVIKSVADFPTPVGNLITLLSGIVYHIDGEVDLGVNSLVIPTSGCSISSLNGARDIGILKSTEDSYTMFVSPVASYSGNVVIGGITLTASGAGSKVFDLTNAENGSALDIVDTNFVSCTSLGELTDYRQLLFNNIGFIFITEGLTFSGNWSGGIAVLTTIAVGFPANTLFKEGTSLVIAGGVRSDINFLSVNAASVLFDFQESNITADGGMSLTNMRTVADDAIPNLAGSSVKARYRDCSGIRNTYVGGAYSWNVAAATVIASPSTFVKAAGTTTYTDLQWMTGLTDNAITHDSDLSIEYSIKGSLSVSGTNNDIVGLKVRKWDNLLSSYSDVSAVFSGTMNASGRVENLTFFGSARLIKGDRLEMWIENQTGGRNATIVAGGAVMVEERSS